MDNTERIMAAVDSGRLPAHQAEQLAGFALLAPRLGPERFSHATWYRRLAQLRACGIDVTAFGPSARTA